MWYIYAIIFHILLLGSIFVIYFRSPVITDLKPTLPIQLEAPAKRLVLFITDGLRAESFFHNNCMNIPKIRQLIVEKGGILGISHTRVPTETRPGHIAIVAGLYEDPSAVTKGWKENPIEFDTIFKRSYKTYAWGAHDVLHTFNKWSQQDDATAKKLFFDSYDHALDFSGSEKTLQLDKWVFERVENFLQQKHVALQQERKVYYFLHLLGLDSAGHIYKPQTELFLENLYYTDAGIYKMYELFEQYFPDNRTTYIITSDHGMTNSGSHGASETYETETPFYIWGAGINHTLNNTQKYIQLNYNERLISIPMHDVEQAQLCPLMATLLGLPAPMNNFGILPSSFLNASADYIAHSMVCNTNQLLEQYIYLLRQHEAGQFSFLMPSFKSLTWPIINGLKSYIKQNLDDQDFGTVLNVTHSLMLVTLKGINYYQNYYSRVLLVATTLAMLAWLYYLLNLLRRTQIQQQVQQQQYYKKYSNGLRQLKCRKFMSIGILLIFMIIFCIVQNLPLQISVYLFLPIFVLLLNSYTSSTLLLSSTTSASLSASSSAHSSSFSFITCNILKSISASQLLILLLCIEFLVISFYKRQMISIGFILFAFWCQRSSLTLTSWPLLSASHKIMAILILILSCFPLLPPTVGYTNHPLWIFGICITYLRPFFIKCRISGQDKLIGAVCVLNALYCVYIHSQQYKLPLVCQMISWSYIVYVIIVLIQKFRRRNVYLHVGNRLNQHQMPSVKDNLEHVIYLLTILYALLCTSYECLFILLLITQLILTLESMQTNVTIPSKSFICTNNALPLTTISNSTTIAISQPSTDITTHIKSSITPNNHCNSMASKLSSSLCKFELQIQLTHCFHLSFLIVLYMFFSFFGCGHMASISSFDPNIIRCFLTIFSPYVIMFLVILKLVIPTFLILCCTVALTQQFATHAEFYIEQLFICLLLICNVMDMNFLFLVRNQGSWLEIGMSISHFVIMQVATLVLILFTYCAKAILLDTSKSIINITNITTTPITEITTLPSTIKLSGYPSAFVNIEQVDDIKIQ